MSEIKTKYGHVGSWAVWREKSRKEKSNVGDLTIFENFISNPNIVFVGLNISKKITEPYGNFHSTSPKAHDYKIRYALNDTQFTGAYMTDIIKDFEEKVSGNVVKYLKNNPLFLQENLDEFEKELQFIGSNDPVIIAFGNDCYKILKRLKKYKIYKVSHYSSRISKEMLREQVLKIESTLVAMTTVGNTVNT